MTLDDIIAEITDRLGEPTTAFTGRPVGDATVDGWTWAKDQAPYGLRIERIGDRHVVRAWRHALLDGRRAELLRRGSLTAGEIRAVVVLGGLLPGADERHLLQTDPWGWNIEHPAACLPDLLACRVHTVAVHDLADEKTSASLTGLAHRLEVALNDFGDRLQILDRVDMAFNDPERSAGGAWAMSGGRS